jgi:hypothetical protein
MEAHDETDVGLGALAGIEMRAPEGFAERVAAAAARRGARGRLRELRATDVRAWARRRSRLGRRALASSAIVAGALVVGLEARHLRRAREVEAA